MTLLVYMLASDISASNSTYTELLCIISLFQLILSLATWYGITGSIFSLYGLFLISAYLFNAGQLLLETFGLNENGILDGVFSTQTTFQAASLAATCLSSMHLGALVAVAIMRRRRTIHSSTDPSDQDLGVIRAVGWWLFSISAVPMVVMSGKILPQSLNQGYYSLYQAKQDVGVDSLPMVIASFLIPAAILMLAGSRGSKITARSAIISIVAYAFVRLAIRLRGHAISPLIGSIWIYDKCVQRISRLLLATLGLSLLLVVFPLVQVSRNIGGEERYSINFYVESYMSIHNPVAAIVGETGGSLCTVAHTIELVPRKRPYEMGTGYLYALLTIFPNVFGGLHPAIAREIPSAWLTWEVDPDTAARGGGLGYSFIAEAYLEFGWAGAPLVVFLFGLGLGLLQLWADRCGGNKEAALVACVMSFVLLFPRAEFIIIARVFVWHSLLPYMVIRVVPRIARPRVGGQFPRAPLGRPSAVRTAVMEEQVVR